MLQRVHIDIAVVRAGSKSQDLLNETIQIIYSLYSPKKNREQLYQNVIRSM